MPEIKSSGGYTRLVTPGKTGDDLELYGRTVAVLRAHPISDSGAGGTRFTDDLNLRQRKDYR